jgi:hypothetical protein
MHGVSRLDIIAGAKGIFNDDLVVKEKELSLGWVLMQPGKERLLMSVAGVEFTVNRAAMQDRWAYGSYNLMSFMGGVYQSSLSRLAQNYVLSNGNVDLGAWGRNWGLGKIYLGGKTKELYQTLVDALPNRVWLSYAKEGVSLEARTISLNWANAVANHGVENLQSSLPSGSGVISAFSTLYDNLVAQGRTVEAAWVDILKAAAQYSQTHSATETEFNNELQKSFIQWDMRNNNYANLNLALAQQKEAYFSRTQNGLSQLNTIFGEMLTYQYDDISSAISDEYVIQQNRFNYSDYLTGLGASADENYQYVEMLHLSTTSFGANGMTLAPRYFGWPGFVLNDAVLNAKDYIRVNNTALSADVTTKVSLHHTHVGTAVVNVLSSTAQNEEDIYLEAISDQGRMYFNVDRANTIISYSGLGAEYYISRKSVLDNVLIIGSDVASNEVVLDIAASVDRLQINLDNHFVNTRVVTKRANNAITGTQGGAYYVGLLGNDVVSLSGGNNTAVMRGFKNNLTMQGINNLVMLDLLTKAEITSSSVAFADADISTYRGGAVGAGHLNTSTIDFSSVKDMVEISITGENNAGYVRTIGADKTSTVEKANFQEFGRVVGSNVGNYISIVNQMNLNSLVLGAGLNTVNVSNSSGLNIVSFGLEDKIFVDGHKAGAIAAQNLANYVLSQGYNLSLIATNYAVVNAVLEGDNDYLDFSDVSTQFNLLEVGLGNHTIKLNGNAKVNGVTSNVIRMMADSVSKTGATASVTNVLDSNRQAGNALYIELSGVSDNFVVSLNEKGLRFTSLDGLRVLNYQVSDNDAYTDIVEEQLYSQAYVKVGERLINTGLLATAVLVLNEQNGGEGSSYSLNSIVQKSLEIENIIAHIETASLFSMAYMPIAILKTLSRESVLNLSAEQIWALNAEQLWALVKSTPLHPNGVVLSGLALLGLSREQLVYMPQSMKQLSIVNMSLTDFAEIAIENLQRIQPEVLAEVATSKWVGFTKQQLLNLTKAQWEAMDVSQKSVVLSQVKPIVIQNKGEIGQLSSEDIFSLTAFTVGQLEGLQLEALVQRSDFNQITAQQLSLRY